MKNTTDPANVSAEPVSNIVKNIFLMEIINLLKIIYNHQNYRNIFI